MTERTQRREDGGPLVTLETVRREYGSVAALGGVSWSVEEGEFVAVTGPSGSGKTTLLNLLAGLDRPTSGRIRVAGVDLATAGARELARYRRETVGVVFQEFHLVPHLTAVENVMLAQYLHSLADREEAAEALHRVGLGDRLDHLPSQLSGGEKQRLCIARALINHPRLILADEPTGNLDAANEERVLELLDETHEQGFTVVVVTHDPVVAARAGRTVRLEHGELAPGAPGLDPEAALLLALWRWSEGNGGGRLTRAQTEAGRSGDYLRSSEGGPQLTARGRRAAAGLVRRLRLAETLLDRTLEGQGSPPCDSARPLSPAREEEVCRFLGHPERCPHGQPIPSGACCPRPSPSETRADTGRGAHTLDPDRHPAR